MTKNYLIIIALALILAIIIGFQFLNKSNENQESPTLALFEPVIQTPDLESRTNNEGMVTVTVTPKSLSDKESDFEIVFDTHTEELTVDVVKSAVLFDDKGKEYLPLDWQGDPPGGHHRSGILKFKSISPQSKSMTIKIYQVGGLEERNFTWQFK